MKRTVIQVRFALLAIALAIPAAVLCQQVADPGFRSVGRGAPLAAVLQPPTLNAGPERFERDMRGYPIVGALRIGTAQMLVGTAWNGAVAAGYPAAGG